MTDRHLTATRRFWILFLCLSFPAWPAGLTAQSPPASHFVFPRFISYPGEGTGIAIFNPSPMTATVSLTLRWPDGTLVTQVVNPVTLQIPGRGQIAKTAGELFGAYVNLDASLEIASSTPGLVAYYQTFDPAVTYLDGSKAPEQATSLIFPVIPGPSEGVSEIDLVNTTTRETSVELKLWNFGGALLGTGTIHIAGGATYRALASDVFPAGASFNGASHITAESKPRNVLSTAQPVAGTSLFAGFFSLVSTDLSVDLAALNAVPLTQAFTSGAFPYFRLGSGYASSLALVNAEPAAVDVTITALANDGSTLGSRSLSLPPQGGIRDSVSRIIPEIGSGDREGWLLIQASGRIVGNLLYGRSDAAAITAIPMQKSPKDEVVFPQVVQGYGNYTEITLVNPTPYEGTAVVVIVAADGTTLASKNVTVGSMQRVSLSLNRMLPEIQSLCGGVVYVRANEPLFSLASIWSESGATGTSFVPSETSFSPAPLTRFAVTGMVRLNGQPAPGFRVALSGPTGALAASAADGTYAFTNLPAGRYSMLVDQFGFQFVPAQANFEITNASIRQDFDGFTLSGAILVQPATLPLNSPDTTLMVFGADFDPTSEVFAGTVRLATAYLDSSHLQATLPAYLMEAAATFDITVVSGSGQVGGPYAFVVYQSRPLLNSVVSAGPIVEGSAGGTLTLKGNGFLNGARVKVNGESDNILVTLINETEIQAYLPSSYFAAGGFYPVTVENPYPANIESNVQLLTVYHAPPTVEMLSPAAVPARLEAGQGPLNLDVFGYGFRRGSVVLFNGAPVPTLYCELDAYCLSVHLIAKVPAELLREAGFGKIEVQNPEPSLANSQAAYLRIDGLKPTITSVVPGSATIMDSPFKFLMPVIVNGTNFGAQTLARVYPAGGEAPEFSDSKVQVISSTELLISIETEYPASLGEWTVEVANQPPGGGISDPVSFFITEGEFAQNPYAISLSPQTVVAGGPSFILTINGTNFKPGSVIYFNTVPLVTTVISSRQVRAEVPTSLIHYAGRIPISVINPDTGGTSNRLFLDIR